jgi:hypothetical protein
LDFEIVINGPTTDPAQLSRALEEWKMLATVFQGMLATPTGERTSDAQQLLAIGHREGGRNWQQWASDLFGWLQGKPDTAFDRGSALNRQND